MATRSEETSTSTTEVLSVDPSIIEIGVNKTKSTSFPFDWDLNLPENSQDAGNLQRAAQALRDTDIPVAFPTETVYGLGADATRSAAVRGIYKAKNRPSDNPLIVHVHSIKQLNQLLSPDAATSKSSKSHNQTDAINKVSIDNDNGLVEDEADFIPQIYKPLIEKFWPGPLTLLMPNPKHSVLAPEVTVGVPTFGARMPSNKLALALIKLADRPLAAPSANASSRPSPTTAQHVKHDLDGRISLIIDGGRCDVGVESTVVDGLADPPAILRPGGIGFEQIRSCKGWENLTIGYKDGSQSDSSKPRAPGMKYRHYSPRAPVLLYEWTGNTPDIEALRELVKDYHSIGIIRTKSWPVALGLGKSEQMSTFDEDITNPTSDQQTNSDKQLQNRELKAQRYSIERDELHTVAREIWEISLGQDSGGIAQGLFSALRELDEKHVGVILVEGIDDGQGHVASAVMNRLRKAAEVQVKS